MTQSCTFRAMNTEIRVLAAEGTPQCQDAAHAVEVTFQRVEHCLSRFRPDSELSALNRSGGSPYTASPLLWHALTLALRAAVATDGVFDPTILNVLEAAGYDRTFEEIGLRQSAAAATMVRTPDYRSVLVDESTHAVTLAPGQRIDLGGIGKGLAVDLAMEAAWFAPSLCINAGGDLRVRGQADDGQPWTVGLEDAGDAAPASVALAGGALATSSILRRGWRQNGEPRHHLIHPRTGASSDTPWRSVSVIAGTCVQADVAAKTALLMGEPGIAWLSSLGLHGFAVRRDGSTSQTALWPVTGAA